jgi:gamma-glutamylputrescine oxidase
MTTSLLQSDTQLNQRSYYESSAVRDSVGAPLQEALNADVVVVGAGFAGLSSAIELAQRGLQVVLLEADRVCSGASGRNGGQAIAGFASGQGPYEEQLGQADARRVWDLSIESIRLLDEHIDRYQIDCDRVHGYLHVADSPRKARALQADMQELHDRYGFVSDWLTGAAMRQHIDSPRYCGAAYEPVSGHLHPLKLGLGLARAARALGVKIYERSPVVRLQRGSTVLASTALGSVKARFAVLAGNYLLSEYGPELAPEITPRIMPVGTYMIGTAPLDPALCRQLLPTNVAAADNNFVLDYFRFSADHRMLFGGRVSYTTSTPARLQQVMRQRMGEVFPALAGVPVEFVWGGFVDISMNRAPDFGRLGHNIYYLQGFSGHGVAATLLGGHLVAQALAGQAEQFDLFARLRHRNFPGGPMLRMPSLVLGTLYHRLRDLL